MMAWFVNDYNFIAATPASSFDNSVDQRLVGWLISDDKTSCLHQFTAYDNIVVALSVLPTV